MPACPLLLLEIDVEGKVVVSPQAAELCAYETAECRKCLNACEHGAIEIDTAPLLGAAAKKAAP